MEPSLKTDIWMPLYWGDLLADTLHLNRSDFGSYVLLIGAYWRNGGPIPSDDESLRTITRCPSQDWARAKGILEKFFTVRDGFWHHKRIEEELEAAIERQTKIVENSRKGVEARRKSGQLPPEPKDEPKDEPLVNQGINQGRTYSQSQSQSHVQTQTHTQVPESVCVSNNETVKKKEDFQLQNRLTWFKEHLGAMFRRPNGVRMSYEEESSIVEIARRPDAQDELRCIEKWKATIPSSKLRFFPQSMGSLLRSWDETLDKARCKVNMNDKSSPSDHAKARLLNTLRQEGATP